VRNLERRIAGVMRFVARKIASKKNYIGKIASDELKDILGPARFTDDLYTVQDIPGVAVGLAWTPVGGDILFIETSASPGKGKLTLTGNLGDVMKESATTALSYIKAHHENLGIDKAWFEKNDIHIHVPEGAIPKDGPSAGVTMLSALTSLMTGRTLKPYLAMSGEITLRGKVLPVGGIKAKILAAKRSGLKKIILCAQNKRHVDEIDPQYLKGLKFSYVDSMSEVVKQALR